VPRWQTSFSKTLSGVDWVLNWLPNWPLTWRPLVLLGEADTSVVQVLTWLSVSSEVFVVRRVKYVGKSVKERVAPCMSASFTMSEAVTASIVGAIAGSMFVQEGADKRLFLGHEPLCPETSARGHVRRHVTTWGDTWRVEAGNKGTQ
jgi:hypothetical protein